MEKASTRPRDRHEIYTEILEFLVFNREPASKTELMQACNLKHSQISEFLEPLLKSIFVTKLDTEEKYTVTDKGRDYLHRWLELTSELIEPRKPKRRFWRREGRNAQ